MEYLQYSNEFYDHEGLFNSFKPCYKWNTFNTPEMRVCDWEETMKF